MKIAGFLCAAALLCSSAASADTIRTRAQCWADGLKLRQGGGTTHLVHSRLNITVNRTDSGVTLDYLGHLETSYSYNGEESYQLADYYGVYVGKDHANTLSPRATVYTDAKYYRFSDLDASTTTAHDGGGIWGYLVVSKKYFDTEADSFDAHYVFQAGDHMGGTVDYTCKRN